MSGALVQLFVTFALLHALTSSAFAAGPRAAVTAPRGKRTLQGSCPATHCWVSSRQNCYHNTSSECQNNQISVTTTSGAGIDGFSNGNAVAVATANNNKNNVVASWLQTANNNNGVTNWIAANNNANNVDRSCSAGQCWVEVYQGCFHLTSQECRFPPPVPVPPPTNRPVFALVTTVHPVQFFFENFGIDFLGLSAEVRATILRWVHETIKANLDPELELIEVDFGGYLIHDDNTVASVPLSITVKGREDVSSFALAVVMEVLRDHLPDLMDLLKSSDWDTFNTVDVSVKTYGFDDVIYETLDPTRRPTTPQPTPLPTPQPTPRPVQQQPEPEPEYEAEQTLPFQFNLDDLVEGYVPSQEDQQAILDIIQGVIRDNLDSSLELVDVDYAGGSRRRGRRSLQNGKSQNSLYLPMDIKIVGSSGVIDLALPDLMQIAEEHKEEIMEKLKDYDHETFKDVDVGYEAKDVVNVNSDTTITNHPVHFIFQNIKAGYQLSERDQDAFIDYIKDLLRAELDVDWELIQVAYASRFELEDLLTPHLPTRVTVRGPNAESGRALPYIIDKLKGRKQDIENFLKNLDMNAFRTVNLKLESHDLPDVTVPTFVTEHPVHIFIKGIIGGYGISVADRTSIVRFVKELIRKNLINMNDALELVDIVYAGRVEGYEYETSSIPLKVIVKGPAGASDQTYDYVTQIVDEYHIDVNDYLKSLNEDVFQEATMSFEEYQWESLIIDIESEDTFIIEETTHPVKLILKNSQGILSSADEALLISFIKQLISENFEDPFTLVDISSNGSADGKSLPLLIKVKGPESESSYALASLIEVFQDHKEQLKQKIKSLDWNAYKDVLVSIETYDPDATESVHHVKLVIKGAPPGSSLGAADRASLLRLVNDLLEENLDDSLTLIGVDSGSDTGSMSLALRVTVEGPSEDAGFASALVLEAIKANKQDISLALKGMDWNAYKDSIISIETYDPEAGPEMKVTVHHVKLVINGAPAGSSLDAASRASILRLVNDLLEKNLDNSLVLIGVASGGDTDDLSLPLRITVEGPYKDVGFALAFVLDALQANKKDILLKLKGIDWSAYKDAIVEIDTYDPTSSFEPTSVIEQTTHPVQLDFEDMPKGYRFSRADKAAIIRYVDELLKNNLDDLFQLVEVADASGSRNRQLLSSSTFQHQRQLSSLSLPILVTVAGPADKSDTALAHVLEAIRLHKNGLLKKVRSLDWGAFVDATLSIGTYDPNDLNLPTKMKERRHPVRINIDGVKVGFRPSRSDQASIINFVFQLLNENLGSSVELVGVADTSRDRRRSLALTGIRRRLDSFSMPLLITVKSKADQSEAESARHVEEVFDDHEEELEDYVQTLDDALRDASIKSRLYDPSAIREQLHPVQILFSNISSNYHLSDADRSSIIHFVEERLNDSLDNAFHLVDVSYASRNSRSLLSALVRGGVYRVGLPILVRVRVADDMAELADAYILQALRANTRDIELYAKSLNSDIFMDTRVTIETGYSESNAPASIMAEEPTPSWVWFLVVIVILFCICCSCMCCFSWMYRYKKQKANQVFEFKSPSSSSEDDTTIQPSIPQLMYVPHSQPEHQIIYHTGQSIHTEQSTDENFIYVPNEKSTAISLRSPLTMAVDPPTGRSVVQRNAKVNTEKDRYMLPATPPTEKLLEICAAPNSINHGGEESNASYSTTSIFPHQTNQHPETFTVDRDAEAQQQVLDDVRRGRCIERAQSLSANKSLDATISAASVSRYSNNHGDEPSGLFHIEDVHSVSTKRNAAIRSAASVSKHSRSAASVRKYPNNALVVVEEGKGNENQFHATTTISHHQDPGGVYYLDDQQSYLGGQSHQSYATATRSHQSHSTGITITLDQGRFGWDEEMALSYATQPPNAVQSQSYTVEEARDISIMRATSMAGDAYTVSSFHTKPPSPSIGSVVSRRGSKTKKKKKKMKKEKRRRISLQHPPGGVSRQSSLQHVNGDSKNGSDDFYYGHSNTFYVNNQCLYNK